MADLIGKTTRNKFANYLAGVILREIDELFKEEDIAYGTPPPDINGARRSLVHSYYSTIRWDNLEDANKILRVYTKILNNLDYDNNAKNTKKTLLECLKKDNIAYTNNELVFINFNDDIKDNIKNIIFATIGEKPEIILEDAVSNIIKIVKNVENCLVYDLPIDDNKGLSFYDLYDWYKGKYGKEKTEDIIKKEFINRICKGLETNPVEKIFFDTYKNKFIKGKTQEVQSKVPALIPQIYLHYDPKTIKELEREGTEKRLKHQRMDFLMLFSNSKRVVIEIDGQQHYSDNNGASPKLYAEMVKYDRWMRLKGYEVYRFGGYELTTSINKQENVEKLIEDFFNDLFKKYNLDFKG